MVKKIIRVPRPDNNPTPDPNNYWTFEKVEEFETIILPTRLIGLIESFNNTVDNLPYPLLSVRCELSPNGKDSEYLLFGMVWPSREEILFGDIHHTKSVVAFYTYFVRDWVAEYFSNLAKSPLWVNAIYPKGQISRRLPGAPKNEIDPEYVEKLAQGLDPELLFNEWMEIRGHSLSDAGRHWRDLRSRATKLRKKTE